MKLEVASGLIRAKMQASGRDRPGGCAGPGLGNMLGQKGVRDMDWVRRHHQGVSPGIRVLPFEPADGPSSTDPQTSGEAEAGERLRVGRKLKNYPTYPKWNVNRQIFLKAGSRGSGRAFHGLVER